MKWGKKTLQSSFAWVSNKMAFSVYTALYHHVYEKKERKPHLSVKVSFLTKHSLMVLKLGFLLNK